MIQVTVTFGNLTAASSQNYAKVIVFTTSAGDNSYTASDVSAFSSIVGKDIGTEIFKIEMDGSLLYGGGSTLATWNDVTFAIDNGVTVAGGENIRIWYY